MLRPVAPKRRRLVVHVGNVGARCEGEIPSDKTRRYAKRFPGFDFVGIDPRPDNSAKPPNWRQLKESDVNGLKRLKDNSVDIISSDMGLGYFTESGAFALSGSDTRRRHIEKSLKLAFEKLKPKGKLLISVGGAKLKNAVRKALLRAGFEPKKIHARAFTKNENGRTVWTEFFSRGTKLYQIIAQK